VPRPEPSKNNGHLEWFKDVDRPVLIAAHANGIQEGKSRLGFALTGHQQSAEPNAVSNTRRALLHIIITHAN
jgi:hypothetical protein